jgi:hypothetical protein
MRTMVASSKTASAKPLPNSPGAVVFEHEGAEDDGPDGGGGDDLCCLGEAVVDCERRTTAWTR